MALQDYRTSPPVDRRSYYRIDDDVFFEYRPLPQGQLNGFISRAQEAPSSRNRLLADIDTLSLQSRSQLKSIRKTHPVIGRFLSTLDEKINAVARHVAAQEESDSGRPNHRVNLSAGGLAFYSDRQVAPESLIAITLKLFPSHHEISTYGPVVYCRYEPEADPDAPYRVGVSFGFMRSLDRESLISHVLGKQIAAARTQRAPLPN